MDGLSRLNVGSVVSIVLLLSFKSFLVIGIEDCITPTNSPGVCVPITDCPNLLTILKGKNRTQQQTRLLRDSQCGETKVNNKRQPKVCCKEDCGVEALTDRIIGGEVTNIDQFPWMALIEYRTKKNTKALSCGATLISDRYVLTAAHCLHPDYISQIGTPESIRLGEYNKKTEVDCVPYERGEDCNDAPVIVDIETIIIHHNYNPSVSQKNDIAIVRLAEKVHYTDFIRSICLPRSDSNTNGVKQRFHVAGWGATETGKSSDIKRQIILSSVPIAKCQEAYREILKDELSDTQICAGGERGKDSCRGDSGGALMSDKESTWTLHGVVSFGPTPCATEGIPGVYTKVFSYMPWIRENIKD